MKQPYKIIFIILLAIIACGFGYTIITGDTTKVITLSVIISTLVILVAGFTSAIISLYKEYPKWSFLIISLAVIITLGIIGLIVFNNNN